MILGSEASGRGIGSGDSGGLVKTGEVTIDTVPPEAEMALTCPAVIDEANEAGLGRFRNDMASKDGEPRTELSPAEMLSWQCWRPLLG